MAIFSSLKTLIRNPSSRCRQAFLSPSSSSSSLPASVSAASSPSIFLPPAFLFFASFRSTKSLVPPFSHWVVTGPLFLSSPPWKLSQAATPLLLRNVEALTLARFPATLGLAPSPCSPPPRVVVERGDFNDGDGCVDNASVVSKGGGFASNFFNLPNSISMARALSGPLIAWMITNQWYLSSCVGLTISGATDWLDGYMARKMRINSVIGSYLDPLADKILIGSVALAMVHDNLLHPGLVGIVVLRDACLIAGGFYTRGSSLGWQWKSWSDYFNIDENSTRKVEPLFISKVNTVLQLALVAGALLQPEWGTEESQSYITYLSWLVASTTIVSSAAYIKQQSWKRSISMTKNC